MSSFAAKIEAILFYRGEPVSTLELAKILRQSPENVREGIDELSAALSGRGIALVRHEDTIALATAPETAPLIEAMVKEERERDLGKAGLETLSIILYRGPITRAGVDYIRGVNSAFIIRQLLMRGLVERTENPKDQRSYLYKPTLELLSYLGVRSVEEMPRYAETRAALEKFETNTIYDDIQLNTDADAPTKEGE